MPSAPSAGALGRHHEAGDDLLAAGLVEIDLEPVALGGGDAAITELAVEHPSADPVRRRVVVADRPGLALHQHVAAPPPPPHEPQPLFRIAGPAIRAPAVEAAG